ncbi:hypothetical protein AKJ46_00265 [candidate division MSBL1 archaeon SCGC-AAA833K04]|uniref:Uncharacterized protein n=1 Tax=candidate division MSBL1 archaeon SCGC-AAA833K04 TaxID=1698258 RepID=A0A133VSV8_9EURY|nr:hypothetical protein AKJ46_00265 [candidate division MSBL1 archaeon SCGC-AAA833K04]
MLNMSQAGVATVTIAVAVVAVAGGVVGTPVAVDQMDVQPDSPFYGLERVGEAIKEATFAGGQGWEIARGRERTREFVNMADKGKASDYTDLLNDAEDRFKKAIESAGDVKGLQRAEEAINKHISRLESVREKVPDVAKPAISLAISQSARGKSVVADVAAGKLPSKSLTSTAREEIKNQLMVVKQNIESLRNRVRENLEKATTKAEIAKIVQNIEFGTASVLASKVSEMADEGKGEYVQPLVEEAQDRIDAATKAAVDNTGLERAITASQKHLALLENVLGKVPDVAKPAISLAISRSARGIEVITDVKAGELPMGKGVRDRLENIKAHVERMRREAEDNLDAGMPAVKIAQNININTAKDLMKKFVAMVDRGKAEDYLELVDEAGDRLDSAAETAVDNKGLQRALKAVGKHIWVLENVKEKVPEVAKSAIEKALVRSRWQERVLENVARKVDEEGAPPELIEEKLENIPENFGRIRGKSFVHGEGRLPDWVPGLPPWVAPGGAPGEDEGEPEELGYALLDDGVRIRNPPATYSVNPANDQGLNEGDVTREIVEAFEAWDVQTSAGLFKYGSTTDKSGFHRDGESVISFAPLEETGAAGKTRMWYDEETKSVLEFDIVLNSRVEWGIDPDGEGPETISGFDIRNITTHEAGHALVLLDVSDEDYGHLTMYYQSEPGSAVKISLESGDINGLRALYGE